MSHSKNRGGRVVADEVPAEETPVASEAASEVPADALKVFSVLIPRCLLGELCFVATDEADAYKQYRELGGITSHVDPQIVKEMPYGSRAYVAAVAKYEAAKAKAEATESTA